MNPSASSSTNTPLLIAPYTIKGLELANRLVIAPMATFSATDGVTDDFHFAHLARFALGGAGLIIVEATAVTPEGRISPGCGGLWNDAQVAPLKRINKFFRECGSASGIQLAHAGRKASSLRPWHGVGPLTEADQGTRGDAPWQTIGPSADAHDDGWPVPHQMDAADMDQLIEAYRAATRRALDAGFDMIEIHGAHGYLLHSFVSPLSNRRNDDYGGDRAGRMRFPLRVVEAVREEWPDERPLFYRVSAVDGIDVGWSIEDSVALAKELKARGVDVVDCSSGGIVLPKDQLLVSREHGFQVPFADQIRREANIATMAVGMIREASHAEAILQEGKADLIAIAREALWNPNWMAQAALELGGDSEWVRWPDQYAGWLRRRAQQLGESFGTGNG